MRDFLLKHSRNDMKIIDDLNKLVKDTKKIATVDPEKKKKREDATTSK